MTQSLILIFIFVGLLACLPMAIGHLKKRYGLARLGTTHESRVVSVVAVGPQQNVVTVEVGSPEAKVWLVLGVTAQSVNHLHTLPPHSVIPATHVPASGASGPDNFIAP